MPHICTKCGKSFTTKIGLTKHMNRRSPCVLSEDNTNNTNKFKCSSCNRYFTTNQSLKKHIAGRCPVIKNKKNEDTTIENMQSKIDVLTETVNELKSIIKISNKTTNNTNCNNVVNNITNHIHINSFLGTNITKEHILNAFLKELSAAAEYAKLPEAEKRKIENAEKNNKLIALGILEIADNVYSDPNNKNAYLHKKNIAKVYDDGDWKMKTLEAVNRELFKIIVEMVEKIKFNLIIPRSMLKYDVQGDQIKETLNTLPQIYWHNISEILKNSEFGLSVLLEANKEDIERIQKEILQKEIIENDN